MSGMRAASATRKGRPYRIVGTGVGAGVGAGVGTGVGTGVGAGPGVGNAERPPVLADSAGVRGRAGRPRAGRGGRGQTRPSFSRAVQQVSVIRRVTTYGSTFAFGRRSSM